MTDEEGLKYAVQHVCSNCSELGECGKGVHCEFLKIVRECYDDAIEIDRKEKWHDLRKNPDDLPKRSGEYWCYDEYVGYKEHRKVYYDGDIWCASGVKVIAWYELPEFEE